MYKAFYAATANLSAHLVHDDREATQRTLHLTLAGEKRREGRVSVQRKDSRGLNELLGRQRERFPLAHGGLPC